MRREQTAHKRCRRRGVRTGPRGGQKDSLCFAGRKVECVGRTGHRELAWCWIEGELGVTSDVVEAFVAEYDLIRRRHGGRGLTAPRSPHPAHFEHVSKIAAEA